jgi:CubicO group peptidase (beta-lactamase class C family)
MTSRRYIFKSYALRIALITSSVSACGHDYKEPPAAFETASDIYMATGDIEAVIDSLAMPLITSGRNIGMIVGVTTPEGDFIKTYGHTDRERKKPMPKDAIFQVGSITKSFAALVTAQFEQDGILSFDDPITKIIPPERIKPGSAMGTVKFGQLPSHTSGMPQEGYTLDLLWGVTSYLVTGDNLYRFYNSYKFKNWVKEGGADLNSSRDYAYSNLAMSLLGWTLGNYQDKGFRHHLHEKVLKPLDLTSTDLTLIDAQVKSLTPGYSGDLPLFLPRHRQVTPWLLDEGISASGGLHMTAEDLLKYCKAAIGKTKTPLLSAFRRTQEPVAKQPDGEMAYSWFIEYLPHTKQKYFHIAGIIGGHTSWVGYDLERGIGVILLQNSINHDDKISVPLLDRLVGAQMKKEASIAKRQQPRVQKSTSKNTEQSGTVVR